MIRHVLRSLFLTLATLTSLIALDQIAIAGPPLLCHPLEIGDARSLPWGGSPWRAVKADYDLNRLVEDTLALLGPETPVIVRMETLRRATIYAVWAMKDEKVGYPIKDLKVANELLSRLTDRVRDAEGKGRAQSLALFDAGYLVESYRQAAAVANIKESGLDGYAWVTKAIKLSGGDPEMEFAAALITLSPRRDTHREHLEKAVAGATNDPLLARNIASHFGHVDKREASGATFIRQYALSPRLLTTLLFGTCLVLFGVVIRKRRKANEYKL